ncbi:sigma factor-like helix-turn-helix DNA-binding protein [Streptomyces sp. NPDC054854]
MSRITDKVRAVATPAARDRLRRSDREVIALSVRSGMGHAETAGARRIAEASVRSRLSRARNRLRELTVAAPAVDPTSGLRHNHGMVGRRITHRT